MGRTGLERGPSRPAPYKSGTSKRKIKAFRPLDWSYVHNLPNFTFVLRIHFSSHGTLEYFTELLEVAEGADDAEFGRRVRVFLDLKGRCLFGYGRAPHLREGDEEELFVVVGQAGKVRRLRFVHHEVEIRVVGGLETTVVGDVLAKGLVTVDGFAVDLVFV